MKLLVILAFVLCISVGKYSSNSTLGFKVYRMDTKSATGSNIYRQRYIAMILYILGLVLPDWIARVSYSSLSFIMNLLNFFLSPILTLWGMMNGPLKFLTARKILPLLDLLAKFKRVLACSCSQNFNLQLLACSLSCQYCWKFCKSFFGLKQEKK